MFLLTFIDVFSKKEWVEPLRRKMGKEVTRALEMVLPESGVRALQTNKWKEFYNGEVRRVLSANAVKHFSSENETIKASVVEHFNRTLRGKYMGL